LKAAQGEADKLREAERGLRMSNVAALAEYNAFYLLLTQVEQEKLSTRIREHQVARQKATEEQDAAIKAAVEKATSELRNAPSTAPDELVKQHAEELRALEERLVAKHQEELNKANEAAAAKTQESQSAPANSLTAEDQKTAIDMAVAAQEAALKAKHDAAVEKALENGRLEATMKLRLKDTQLIRAQNKVKELEGQIEEWKKAGIIPGGTAAEPTSASSATSSSLPVGPPSASAPSPTTSTSRGGMPMGAGAALVRKASVASGAAAGASGQQQPARGRGRGGVRGSIGIRGAAVPGAGRGASTAPQGSAGGKPVASAGGVSIMGAASKRTREEGEVLTEDSLSKRLKPAVPPDDATPATATAAAAEGSAGTSAAPGTGGKPITLQRNRVQPS
jgi:nucleoprotein TPR